VNARTITLLAAAQLAIGAAAIFARFALADGGPIAVSALRLLIASVPLAVVAAFRGAFRLRLWPTERRLALAGLMLALHFALWIASLQYASVAVSTLLVCTTPIFTEVYAVARARRIRGDILASIALALVGVAIVVGAPAKTDTPLGIVLALGGSVAIAVYLILIRGTDARYSTLAVVGRTYPIAALILLAATVLVHDPIPPFAATSAWAGILAMALLSQLFGHTALNAAVRTLSATFVATVTLIEPAIAAGLAALIFHERLSPATLGGSVLILAAIGIALRAEARTQ
jgi:drug/metabolite transporter (DMT)-like permease